MRVSRPRPLTPLRPSLTESSPLLILTLCAPPPLPSGTGHQALVEEHESGMAKSSPQGSGVGQVLCPTRPELLSSTSGVYL